MLELFQTEWCPGSRRIRQRLTELGLDGAGIAQVNRLFKRISRILYRSRAGPGRRLFAVTYVLVPLDRRPRRQKEPRHAKRR